MFATPPSRILIVKPSSLGDVVHALPVLDALHRCFPKAEIHWVISRGLEGLLEGNPLITRLWIIDKQNWKSIGRLGGTVREVSSLFRELRTMKFDLVLDLQGLLRSGLIARATQAKVRVGFSEAREGSTLFYTDKVRGGRDIHAVDRYLKIPEAFGCRISQAQFPLPGREPGDAIRRIVSGAPYAVLVPGARWATKRWSAERFGEVARRLPLRSLVVGGDSDKEYGEIIERVSGGKAVSCAGETDLPELVTLIRRASFMVTNDSGPMHIAAAAGVPVVAIFGPTSAVRTGPYGTGHIVLQSKLPCAPCFKRKCDDPKCLRDISVDRVLEAVQGIIKRK